jgi:alkanesulfonate monooxygenase SsuD/methylene tetrahydromethanopterin reductase-like flavin-dependent oxidoreductase (luciferase family)
MKLGLGLGYWSAGPPPGMLDMVLEAERLGFDSVWTAEAYGSDALTPLAWYGSHTSRIKLGTGICQMPARTPTALGMAAMTLDHLSEGRVLLGVGASGPQVVEGWYGQPYPKPLARSREYIDILRKTIARQPVEFSGDHYTPSRRRRARQGAEVDDPPPAQPHPDLPRRRGAEEHRPGGRDRRRLGGDALLPQG